ncbi:MAG: ATP-binding cassette domain-containing protein [Candidatus Zixiibacteriota bacterium]|nr:MAG: ATP-binding cassette domain-containing protein [candidate division Zixibacteria bacterium]
MIAVQNLTKYYGTALAVNNISFEVEKGTVLGFLGPNGAGKTTTVRIITCYLSPTAGTVTVDDKSILTESLEVRKRIGYLPENAPLYLDMNVVDYIRFMQNMRADGAAANGRQIKEVIARCGLEEVLHKTIGELSKGYRQRVGLAQALVHNPEILIFDEPTVGLDPNQIIEIRNLIKELGRDKTIILCSHILPEVEATCNRVLIISEGEIVADGTPAELQASFEGKGKISLQVKNNCETFMEKIVSVPGIERVAKSDQITPGLYDLDLETVKGTDPREDIFNLCRDNESILMEMKREETSLEDVFRQLTAKEH